MTASSKICIVPAIQLHDNTFYHEYAQRLCEDVDKLSMSSNQRQSLRPQIKQGSCADSDVLLCDNAF